MEHISLSNNVLHDRFIIRDTGIGMSEEFLSHLFEPFAQENRSNLNPEHGTGLGLTIVKKLVDLMGGTLKIKSEINKGTEVIFEVDFKIDDERCAKKSTTEDSEKKKISNPIKNDYANLSGKKILLCEDNELNAQIAKTVLEEKSCTVTWAEDGKKGLEIFSKSTVGTFDAILMDIRMPVMNGFESANAIRSLEREDAATVPIIAVTANAYDEDMKHSLEVGMNAHLAKPYEIENMYKTISELIKK